MPTFDPVVLGHRVRHARKHQGLTLDQLGSLVSKPGPYLSLVETGKREPKLSLVAEIATALKTDLATLLDPEPPTPRARLEVALGRIQEEALYSELGLPHLKATASMSDNALGHIVTLYDALVRKTLGEVATPEEARKAAVEIKKHSRSLGNFHADIEAIAAEALEAIGYSGAGALSQRDMIELASHFGFSLHTVQDFPPTARAIADKKNGRLFIPQRDELRTRQARYVIAQTLGHVALGHRRPSDYLDFFRQRIQANYFASALLIPNTAGAKFLSDSKRRRDLAVEDLKERFYTSYETAAHRFTNLATKHLDIPVHLLRVDHKGIIRSSYENDGIPLPSDPDGIVDGHRVCKQWASRKAVQSNYKFDIYYQYTDTPAGTYWESAYLEVDRTPSALITLGTDFPSAQYFRGRNTDHKAVSRCPNGDCCRTPDPSLLEAWGDDVWPTPHSQKHLLAALPQEIFPGTDLGEVIEFVSRQ
jgi:predicted transcriptional regulator/transcriptional regulator with XRE-family HTH domain